jgi:hypothetical protein
MNKLYVYMDFADLNYMFHALSSLTPQQQKYYYTLFTFSTFDCEL